MENIYEANKTMKLLGKQNYTKICPPEIHSEVCKIVTANVDAGRDFNMMIADIFVYGYIMGQKAERQKKKK